VVTETETRKKLAAAANNQAFVGTAAAVIAGCSTSDHVMRCGQGIAAIDVSIAMEHIALQATELGLATCWIGSFFPDKVRAVLGIDPNVAIIELMTIGYPADKQPTPKRMPVDNIVCYEKWRF
jgi:nitroreductase